MYNLHNNSDIIYLSYFYTHSTKYVLLQIKKDSYK